MSDSIMDLSIVIAAGRNLAIFSIFKIEIKPTKVELPPTLKVTRLSYYNVTTRLADLVG